ncbi:hypothetical protein PVAP13_3KG243627 [Panicum virgatum]|uniref:Uncharacterized protein n=1 Tax=Panicum virgatum TaxID=38727 RepID=A0A8T0V4E4_PANVG|nr:hypothetical protein PVAP13_3KG243627 [Panicum virgatum]
MRLPAARSKTRPASAVPRWRTNRRFQLPVSHAQRRSRSRRPRLPVSLADAAGPLSCSRRPRPPRLSRRRRRRRRRRRLSRAALGPRVRLGHRRRRHALAALASSSRCRPPPAWRRRLARLLRELHASDPRASSASTLRPAGSPLLGQPPLLGHLGPPTRAPPPPAHRRG